MPRVDAKAHRPHDQRRYRQPLYDKEILWTHRARRQWRVDQNGEDESEDTALTPQVNSVAAAWRAAIAELAPPLDSRGPALP